MKKIINTYFQFLRYNSDWSTMRIVIFIIVIVSAIYILFQMLMKLPIDFFGVTGYVAVALTGKFLQKKDEHYEKTTETTGQETTGQETTETETKQ